MDLRKIILLSIVLMIPFFASSQRIWRGDYNRLGLQGGVNYFNIHTGDLPVDPGISWTAGFSARASFYNDFQFVYGINFFDFQSKVAGRASQEMDARREEIQYNMIGVQGSFLGSYKLFDHFLSVEAGPVVQVNGKYEARQDKELYYIEDYNIQATEIEDVSTFNFLVAVGLTGGFESFKFWVQYQYGINNFLSPLNDKGFREIDTGAADFEGNLNIIAAGVVMFL